MTQSPHIFIIDSNAGNYKKLERTLYENAYNPVFVRSGTEAMAYLREFSPDLILLDALLPDMSSAEICRQVKTNPSRQHIPIILVTSLDTPESMELALEVGADDYLFRPVRKLELLARIAAQLGVDKQPIESSSTVGPIQRGNEQNLLSTLMDNHPDLIFVKNLEGRFVTANTAYLTVQGLESVNEIVGKTDFDFSSDELARQYQADDQTVIELGIPLRDRVGLVSDQHGNQKWSLTTKVPLHNSDGEIEGVVGISRDITTLQQANNELIRAKDTAEAANKTKSYFLANVSHELRTPLNAIIGMTSLLLDTPLDEKQQEFTETIRIGGDSLLTLINDILDFSKMEAGKLELEKQVFNLQNCVEEVFDLLTPQATEKGLELAFSIEENSPTMFVGDVTRIRQVLSNLLDNAVKFTENGQVTASVTGRSVAFSHMPETKNNYELHFAVKDTGIGIPADRKEHLFEPFSQVDPTITRRYGGTGLGLVICKRLVEMMGGKIWAENDDQSVEGSTFHFTIIVDVASGKIEPQPKTQLTGKRLLIVDSNANSRHVLTRQAQSWGMFPIPVDSGVEALEWLKRGEQFDVGIVDMQTPGTNGMALVTEIRKHYSAQKLPLVMVTSLRQRSQPAPVAGLDVSALLVKPVRISRLHEVLLNVFADIPGSSGSGTANLGIDREMGQNHPLRILLAEDNGINQRVVLRMLERMSYRADVVANGVEVLDALSRQTYDVVLMDVRMPEMDGLEATQKIRSQLPPGKQPYIVAVTADALMGGREEFLDAGMDEYLSKPVRAQDLARVLSQYNDIGINQIEETPQLVYTLPLETADVSAAGLTNAVLDRSVLDRLRTEMGHGGEEVVAELIDVFLADLPNQIIALEEAIAANDGPVMTRIAHTLKSGSAMLGVLPFSALCREVELLGGQNRVMEAAQKVPQLVVEATQVKEALLAVSPQMAVSELG